MQEPTVGRIVHYHHQFTPIDVTPLAAIVTAVTSAGRAWLVVFLPAGGTMDKINVEFSSEPKANYWSWPPRA